MKKIAFVINSLAGGGAEKQLSRMLNYYADSNLYASYQVELILLDVEDEKQHVSSKIKKVNLDSQGGLVSSTTALLNHVKKANYCILISFLTRANCASIVVGKLLGIPVVISERVNTTAHLGSGIGALINKTIVKLLYPLANHVCCVSDGVRQELVTNYRISATRSSVIYNGYDYTELNNLATQNISTPPDYICAVGRLVENKNFALLLDAYKRADINLPLLIAGDGPLKENLSQKIQELELSDKVTLLGYINNPYPIIKNSKFLVSSSNAEGFPNAIAEALVLGVPVVATDCPSGPAEVLDGNTSSEKVILSKYGILVKCNEIDSLAKGVSLMNGKETYLRYLAQAKIRGRSFTIEQTTESYFSLIAYWTNC